MVSRCTERPRRPTLTATRTTIILIIATTLLLTLHTISSTIPTLPKTIPTTNRPSILHLTPSGTFQISIFQDLHYGEAENTLWGPSQDLNTTTTTTRLLSLEKPDLAVLNGDLITGKSTSLDNATHYIDQLVQPFVQGGFKWASVYGNHDSDFNLSRAALFEREKGFRGCLTRRMVVGDDVGVSNYYIPVYPAVANISAPSSFLSTLFPSEEEAAAAAAAAAAAVPAFILWFFDSRGGKAFKTPNRDSNGADNELENWVHPAVAHWFETTHQRLKKRYGGLVVPSVAFVHIPITAMLAFQDAGLRDPRREPGVDDDVPLAAQGDGDGRGGDGQGGDGKMFARQDEAFVKALLGTEGLMGVFSGHDHGDTWCQRWNGTLPGINLTGDGLNLCFGQHSGYGGYGSWIRGSRQILLRHGSTEIETWNRLEDGSVSGRVVLNASYGEDVYAAVEDRYS